MAYQFKNDLPTRVLYTRALLNAVEKVAWLQMRKTQLENILFH